MRPDWLSDHLDLLPSRSPGSNREVSEFRVGQRLEAVDRHNPALVRVAGVVGVAGRQVKVHYDGWPDEFDIWSDDCSPLLQPVGWAARTGHPLQVPQLL